MTFPALLLGAILSGVGSAVAGRQKANEANRQAENDYAARKAEYDNQEKRRIDTLNFMEAVLKARGSKVPQSVFDGMKRMNTMAPYQQGYKPSFLGSLAGGIASSYGQARLQAAMNAPAPYAKAKSAIDPVLKAGTKTYSFSQFPDVGVHP